MLSTILHTILTKLFLFIGTIRIRGDKDQEVESSQQSKRVCNTYGKLFILLQDVMIAALHHYACFQFEPNLIQ